MNYEEEARQARIKTLELIYKAQVSHVGSNFSCVDILTVLFNCVNPQKDEAILSKGWAAASWYYFLWRKGVITENELNSFCQPNSKFIGLVEPQFIMVQCDCNAKEGIQMEKEIQNKS